MPGRGRWKIGLPRSGIPPRGGTVGRSAVGDGGGAAYTGRGPVCGTIMRRTGAAGRCGVAGLAGTGTAVAAGAAASLLAVSLIAVGAITTSTGGTSAAGTATSGLASIATGACSSIRVAAGLAGSLTAAAGTAATGFAGMVIVAGGRATDCGVIKRGAGLAVSTGATDTALAATAGG